MLISKRSLFFIAALILVWMVCDTIVYFYLQQIQSYRNIFYGIQVPDNSAIEHLKKTFHPDWGWDIKVSEKGNLGIRRAHAYSDKPVYKLKAFGDSYTFCVTGDKETWSYFIEDKFGWDCLNYGVGGYGPDQALQKYKGIPYKSEYVLLGILDENIGRIMTNWWGFYHKSGIAVKPRYTINQQGCAFIPNPINNAADLNKLGNIDFLNQLKEYDYWHNYFENINAPDELKWPATFTVLKNLNFFVKYIGLLIKNQFDPTYASMLEAKKFYHLYNKESDGHKILECIVDEFIRYASQRDEHPIILLFPIKYSVDLQAKFKQKPYQIISNYLDERNIPFIDFGEVFIKEDYAQYYDQNGGHLSAKGNERVADEIVRFIRADN